MREGRPVPRWQTPHREWRSDHSWPPVASSYALDDEVRLLRALVLVSAGMLVLVGVLFLGACGGEERDAVNTSAATATAPAGEPIVIRATLIVAAEEGSEPIATGTVLEGSTLGGTSFCVGGTILESHASLDPKMKAYLIDRKISCPDGTVRIGFTPEVAAGPEPEGQTPQKGVWTIVSGTGEFERAERKRKKRGRVWHKPQFAGSLHIHRNRHAIETR
jgi:hypothetical protein